MFIFNVLQIVYSCYNVENVCYFYVNVRRAVDYFLLQINFIIQFRKSSLTDLSVNCACIFKSNLEF